MAEHRLFAAAYDRVTARAEAGRLGCLRRSLLARATGRLLDVGAGTGANLVHLPAAVSAVVACEPDGAMRRRLERRLGARPVGVPVDVVARGVPGLGLEDGSFDTIVSTLVLCTVDDPQAALAELRELLAPNGRLLFLEHVRSPGAGGEVEHLLAPLWRRVAAGCRIDRDTIGTLRAAGFVVADCERPPLVGEGWGKVLVTGSAVAGVQQVA